MYKRLFAIFLLLTLFNINLVFSECFFNTYSDECQRFSSPYNSFTLDFTPISFFQNFEVKIYNKDNPSNEILIRREGNEIKNINPFIQPGVYVLEVKGISKSEGITTKKIEYIFDNTQPTPPIIPIIMSSTDLNLQLQGNGNPGEIIISEKQNKETRQAVVDSNSNYLINLNLVSGWNYFKFFSQKSNGAKSEIIERSIFGGNLPEIRDGTGSINGVLVNDLSLVNSRTIKQTGSYITSKRDFYIEGFINGANLLGTIVYVNGVKTFADANGKYASFVNLNEGNNDIIIESGSITSIIKVTYLNPKFAFTNINYDKVINANSNLKISGSANFDVPFNVYLNGDYLFEAPVNNGLFDFNIAGLKIGKNYIFFEGINGAYLYDMIYVDSNEPQAELISNSKYSVANDIIFKITDDIAVDIDTVVLNIGGMEITSSQVEEFDSYYKFDISDLEEGTYPFGLGFADVSGKVNSISGTITIDKTNTLIERITLDSEEGSVFANNIFVKKGKHKLTLIPSRYIAFEKIYLDGIEQTDYEIKINSNVELNLDFQKSQGEIEFVFINGNYDTYIEKYKYYTDDEKPVLSLDYITTPYVSSNKNLWITGSVSDSYFLWESLAFNEENKVLRFGDNFEAYVSSDFIGSGNLEVFGRDITGNRFENPVIGGILSNDQKASEVQLNKFSKDSVKGSLKTNIEYIKNYASSYDGFNLKNTYVANNFDLGVSQRQGVRNLNFKGFEESGLEFKNYDSFSVDSQIPSIYFIGLDSNNLKIILDGTLSSISDFSILVDSQIPSVINTCSNYNKVGYYDTCKLVQVDSDSIINVEVSDTSGNNFSREFNLATDSFDVIPFYPTSFEIFFSGNNYYSTTSSSFVQGQVKSSSPLKEVKIGNSPCEIDDYNFVCKVSLALGINSIQVSATNVNGESTTNTFTQEYVTKNLDVSLDGFEGNSLFNVNGKYFTLSKDIDILGSVSKSAIITLLLDSKEIKLGTNNGDFKINIDYSINIVGKTTEELEFQLKAEDEKGFKAFSDKLTLIYNRLSQTIVNIIIG